MKIHIVFDKRLDKKKMHLFFFPVHVYICLYVLKIIYIYGCQNINEIYEIGC